MRVCFHDWVTKERDFYLESSFFLLTSCLTLCLTLFEKDCLRKAHMTKQRYSPTAGSLLWLLCPQHQQLDTNVKASYIASTSRKSLSLWSLDILDILCSKIFSGIFKCMITVFLLWLFVASERTGVFPDLLHFIQMWHLYLFMKL